VELHHLDGLGPPKDRYSWVECGAFSGGWQVLDFAEERVG
jgi:hypothetical protein